MKHCDEDGSQVIVDIHAQAPLVLFAIKNERAGRAVFYVSRDPSMNQLTLMITNYTGAPLSFTGGENPTTIDVDFATLLTETELRGMKIALAGWNASLTPLRHSTVVRLTPTADGTLVEGASLAFAITVAAVTSTTSDDVTIHYQHLASVPDGFATLHMSDIAVPNPAASATLPVNVAWLPGVPAVVYVSGPDQTLIANTVAFAISNQQSAAPLVAAGAPHDASPPSITLRFSTIERPDPSDPTPNPGLNALTYKDLAKDIGVRVVGDAVDGWTVDPPIGTSNESLVWNLKPSSTEILGPGASVEIFIENIRTTLPAFTTALYLEYRNIPGYQDGEFVLHLQKTAPTPGILTFFAEASNVEYGAPATLSWSTFAADTVELSYLSRGAPVLKSSANGAILLSESSYAVPSMSDLTVFQLTAYLDGQALPPSQVTVDVDDVAVAMTITPLTIAQGGTALLDWSVTDSGATTCVLDPGAISLPLSGTGHVLTAQTTTTFSITAQSRHGTHRTQQATLSVQPVSIDSFTASTTGPVDAGTAVTLSWTTEFASSFHVDPTNPPVSTGTSCVVHPENTTTYQLTCEGFQGPVSKTVTVNVNSVVIDTLTASPASSTAGQPVTLSWTTTHASSCSIDSNVGGCATNGSVVVHPGNSTIYTLTANGPDGPVTKQVPVTVTNEPLITGFSTDSSGWSGTNANFYWSTTNVSRCHISVVGIDQGHVFVNQDLPPNGSLGYMVPGPDCNAVLTAWGPDPSSQPVSLQLYLKDSNE